jgi:signal transduction histidine kinase
LAQLARKRTALALYSLLLVLPTLVLGGLHWHQLVQEQVAALAQIPVDAEAAGRRLVEAIRARLESLLRVENDRLFTAYQKQVFPDDLLGPDLAFVPTDLSKGTPPRGVVSWFVWRFREGIKAPYELFSGDRWEVSESLRHECSDIVEELIEHDYLDGFPKRITRYSSVHESRISLPYAVINLSREEDFGCLEDGLPELAAFEGVMVDLFMYDFHVRFYTEPDGTPRLLATRLVLIDGNDRLKGMPPCYSDLAAGTTLMQGFFIDPTWFFDELPRELVPQVLSGPETFHGAGSPLVSGSPDAVVERIYLVDELDFEVYDPENASYGELSISISTKEIRDRHRRQVRGFFAVALMLLLSLGTGMALLLRAVRRDLEQAQRTENFVAAVTHELRTPVSAIRLYGEMLRDGWTTDPEKQGDYYRRIVDETHRLETMVERVLEKSQLTSAEAKPQPGDVSEFLNTLVQRELGAPDDVRLELAPEFPTVLLTPEALRSIVINLIENARKYAPVDPDDPGSEPILVRTDSSGRRPLLEVLDRGPGIPDEEKRKVFEAFYRRGDEGTRRSRGTGLGLHLVKIQAQSIGGDAEILDRPGGGSVFRVYLREVARDSTS